MVKTFVFLAGGLTLAFFALYAAALIDFSDSPPILLGAMLFWAAIISLFFGMVSAAIPVGLWHLLKK